MQCNQLVLNPCPAPTSASTRPSSKRCTARRLALLFAAAMMLEHVGNNDLATRIHAAVDKTLNEDSVRTGDLGGKATTRELTQAIIRRLG